MNVETLFTLAARTAASTNGNAINILFARDMVAIGNVTAVTGTNPTLDIKFQESLDGTTWIDIPSATLVQWTGTGTKRLEFASRAAYVRAVSTIGGTATPTFTYSLHLCGKM